MAAHERAMTDLDVLHAMTSAATRGPWHWEPYRAGTPVLIGRAGEPGVYGYDVEILEADHFGECGCRSACTLELKVSDADKAYLATVSPDVILELIRRVGNAEAAIERVRALQPTWTQGMYGSPDDMFSRTGLARALGD